MPTLGTSIQPNTRNSCLILELASVRTKNEFSIVEVYKINTHTVAFVYTNNWQYEKESMKIFSTIT